MVVEAALTSSVAVVVMLEDGIAEAVLEDAMEVVKVDELVSENSGVDALLSETTEDASEDGVVLTVLEETLELSLELGVSAAISSVTSSGEILPVALTSLEKLLGV